MSDVNPFTPTAGYGTPAKDRFHYPPLPPAKQNIANVMLGILVVATVASYAGSLVNLWDQWRQPQYEYGGLVPVFAAVLLWLRREAWRDVPLWHRWVGLGILALGAIMRALGTIYVIYTVDNLSLIPTLMGVWVMVGGLPTLRWAAPALAFLAFMFPLPDSLADSTLRQLKRVATVASHYSLETLGVDCVREGNVIQLELGQDGQQKPLGVADACAGLRMLTIFIAMSVALVMISPNRPWWERLLVVISSVPIALAVNIIRITVTGLMYSLNFKNDLAEWVLHDVAGWVMMPMAIGMLYLVTLFLSNLLIEEEGVASPAFSMGAAMMPGLGGQAASGTTTPPRQPAPSANAPRGREGTG